MTHPLIVLHALEYSGAPLAGFELAQALQRQGSSPRIATLRDGPLRAEVERSSAPILSQIPFQEMSFVVANSVTAVDSLKGFIAAGGRVGVWIHEDIPTCRQLQSDRLAADDATLGSLAFALVPARFQMSEFEGVLPRGRVAQLRNVVTQQAFRPDAGDHTFAVVGAWSNRKGQRQLLGLARMAGIDCQFKFVGCDASDATDALVDQKHRFTGKLDRDAARAELARAAGFVSASTNEVQPLATLEAVLAGKPALLSDIPAHREIASEIPNVSLFDRDNPSSFRAGFLEMYARIGNSAVAVAARRAVEDRFGPASFDRRVAELLPHLRGDPGAPPLSIVQF